MWQSVGWWGGPVVPRQSSGKFVTYLQDRDTGPSNSVPQMSAHAICRRGAWIGGVDPDCAWEGFNFSSVCLCRSRLTDSLDAIPLPICFTWKPLQSKLFSVKYKQQPSVIYFEYWITEIDHNVLFFEEKIISTNNISRPKRTDNRSSKVHIEDNWSSQQIYHLFFFFFLNR